jgi:hypothetical protein
LDGSKYAPTVARKTRSVLSNVFDYAIEEKLLDFKERGEWFLVLLNLSR